MFKIRRRRQEQGVNVVPILNLFIIVIFFLVLSTNFEKHSQYSMPAFKTAILSEEPDDFIEQKIILRQEQENYAIQLRLNYNSKIVIKEAQYSYVNYAEFEKWLKELGSEFFAESLKKSKLIQLGAEKGVGYQKLLHFMESISESGWQLALLSPEDSSTFLKDGDGEEL